MRLLMVEDNSELSDWLARLLRRGGWVVDVVPDAETALQGADFSAYDVAVVDLGLPGADGFSVVRGARAAGHGLPILILTARDAVKSRVQGLDAGADDYLVKPFEVEELEARLRALARRAGRAPTRELRFGRLALDLGGGGATVDGA
ncbi:MAG: response regulator, partial [Hyphomicrobiales bacterium]|nr:response regulator [Hyphomicrobiales bacterium]